MVNRRSFLTFVTALTGTLTGMGAWLARQPLLATALPQGRSGRHPLHKRRPPDGFRPPPSKRQDIDLNDAWRFNRADVGGAEQVDFDDSTWNPISLPHTWNNIDGQQHTNYYRGVGWYRRHYIVDASLAGMNFYLQFDAANIVTDVHLNGISVGRDKGGLARFRV